MISSSESRVEELEEIIHLSEGADGRASCADGVFLLNGNRGRDTLDFIDLRLVHAVEELPDVRGEGLDITSLSLGVEGVESERGFSRAGRPGDY